MTFQNDKQDDEVMAALLRSRDVAMEWAARSRIPECAKFSDIAQDLDFVIGEILALREELSKMRAEPSDEHVSVVGMPEFDALLDHIYEYGTASEGIIDRANAFARAILARYGQPAAPTRSLAMTVNTQELRELLEKATPGKWVADGKAVSSDHGHRTSICGTYGIAWPCGSYSNAEADAALIAAARNALPALLAEIDALRVRVAQLAENDTYETEYERNAEDAARWRYIRRKLCLIGNGDGTCAMQAINLPAAIQGWPEPEQVAEFYDAVIDAAMQRTSGGDHG